MDRFLLRTAPTPPRPPLADVSNSRAGTIPAPERPAKRIKVVDDSSDGGEEEDSSESPGDNLLALDGDRPPETPPNLAEGEEDASSEDDGSQTKVSASTADTAFENSLPPVETDKEAIDAYEASRAIRDSSADASASNSKLVARQWLPGKSSIYVDAFNLALDTVLEDEAHLFDEKEKAVFRGWRSLGYEAQYLYVRLFLRKTSAWHRSDRLGYYSDISDPDAAIQSLQRTRALPTDLESEPSSSPLAGIALQDWTLGDSFTFADSSEEFITTVEEAASLLGLDELKAIAKEAKVQGKNKAELQRALVRISSQQANLPSLVLRRPSTETSIGSGRPDDEGRRSSAAEPLNGNGNSHFLAKILAITGPCIRLSPPVFKLFERVHLVFYRSTEWTEKSLTAIILAKISRRNFPEYIVCRSSNIFACRQRLLEFEQAMRMEYEVDQVLEFNGPPGEEGFRRVLDVFDSISAQWRRLLRDELCREQQVYEFNEGVYLRRFNAAHAYTRIAHKAAYVLGRLHEYEREHALLCELLDQRLFQMARRGAWYQRKALLEEHYMHEVDPEPKSTDPEQQKKHWCRVAVQTCQQGLEDPECHLIYHYDLQKRLLKLERRLRIPRRLQHDFGHVRLHAPEEHTVEGVQLKKELEEVGKFGRGLSTKTIWVDEAEGGGECSVEAMCLSHYRSQGWKGYHSEGGIMRTLFAYLMYDVLFLYIPNVFQTAYQTCPLDLHTDGFYAARASEINRRLVEIANGEAERIVREVHAAHAARRTCVVGLNWDFELEDVAELVRCFRGEALAAVCKVLAQEYRQRGGGVPDLLLWRGEPEPEVLFVEVKSANDRLSDTQRLWIHALTGAGVRVALCNAVAREVRVV